MTLMIGATALAKRLYEAWRKREDVAHPLDKTEKWDGSLGRAVLLKQTHPRPKWEHLDSIQQGVWRAVAEEAARTLADAIGAR